MSLTTAQIQAIIVTERVSSVFSLTASAFVVVTFLLSDKFRKPINRLVFYATFGNVITNIATLISIDGIEAGKGSSLCQFQAFLIQWFMPADALWTFAMSCNVWLSFFRSYDAAALRRLEWKYLLACYGVPFVPGLIYLFVNTIGRGKIYGSAVLWCWVSLQWDFLRVATFYGPVWIVILCTIAIYIRVGSVIFKWRKQLLSMERPGEANEFPATGIIKTSEVTVTRNEEYGSSRPNSGNINKKASFPSSSTSRHQTQSRVHRPGGGIDPNKAALKYCKCALLFFIALLITWVPSTVNRIYTIIRPTDVVFGLNLAAALVLPLQGFWNAIIYMATSSYAVKCLWGDIKEVCRHIPSRRLSEQMKRQAATVHTTELDDRASKMSSNTINYDPERSSSQSELVGVAK
ncbi:hypothetical protein PMZ80_007984 [Knufia obscura]|uniref:G-protein coupled receptors family 2 profile 2 domain-containing protein n=2 Tax=Knufia TaxID=430999 RepID=A0AAN8I6U4_9EURO|nr:hypothetical protein PMZ80_007984 [Knufia obscura]KAK5957287.1 hypothetical protein OHC33_001659 [Knufia fluminis]